MKRVSKLILLSALVFVGCNCPQKETKDESKKEIVPMELNSFETIKLLAPNTEGGMALLKAAQNRKSYREFAETNLSLEHLSEILWMANGINREDGKRTVPSARALYPLDLYAVLSNGIYFYNPETHELQPVVEGDYRNLTGLQPFVEKAPLNLVFIANFEKYEAVNIPEEKWLYLAALDAGHCAQNVYLYCASEGLKSVVRAGAKEQELLAVMKLGEKHRFIVAHSVGY